MRFINTRIHGVLDYLTAGLMMASPAIFNFARGGPETSAPIALGITVMLYSFCTRYEFGAIKAIPMHLHLILDFFGGLFLASSPWLLGFGDLVYVPHLAIGVFEMVVPLFTQIHPSRQEREQSVAHA